MKQGVQEQVPLAPLTTMQVGGTARFFAVAESTKDVVEAVGFAREKGLPLFVLGGGSNVVIADEGFDGLVLQMRLGGMTFSSRGEQMQVTAGAGIEWDMLVRETLIRGHSGLECLSGIPGTVGGAVVANAGAYGAQCSDVFQSAEVCDRKNGKIVSYTKDACQFSYHDSVFSQDPDRYIILSATFDLAAVTAQTPTYTDSRFSLAELVAKDSSRPPLLAVREAVLTVREEKGMLHMIDRPSYKSAGSFFHMPYVSAEDYARVVQKAQELDGEKEERLRPWAWKQPDGTYKIATGFLLEYTEFRKGYVRGSVGISPKHILSIINLGGARACDVTELAHDMQKAVNELFAIPCEREVIYVGSHANE
jgi:UDP-N-acetylmuramate dehydrogenase